MKIYTRQGDDGSTGLFGGQRLGKGSARVETYGLVDEANATLGWARAATLPSELDKHLEVAQETCFRLGAWLASAPGADPGVAEVSSADVQALETAIDACEPELPPLKHFILPGGAESAARLHVARTVVRRAERALASLVEAEPVGEYALPWLNRLSDYLFVAARLANHRAGVSETVWKPRAR